MATIEFTAFEFESAGEALQHAEADRRGVPISCGDKYLVVEQVDADRLAAGGVEFAYLVDHEMPDGTFRIMTIPIND